MCYSKRKKSKGRGIVNILIVEDEKHLNDLLHDYVKDAYPDAVIHQVYDGLSALNRVSVEVYDLILLDVMLPHMGGFEVCKKIRESSSVPIIMLSALNDEENQIKGYNLGIDEYVTKPYSPKLVIKKIEAVLARYEHTTPEEMLKYGVIEYNLTKYKITVDQQIVELNKKEWELFTLFINNIGRMYTREDLLNLVWGFDYFGYERTVDTHIKRLRQKLGSASSYVRTVYKSGYKFEK
ncbi:MAG TPA: DNA-binding response regulator [Acholeplasmataceae bacterium]|nr:DNA-binding response regulator [Acholeplasmataceae bacterium]